MLSRTILLLAAVPLGAATPETLAATPETLYKDLISADHWREQAKAVHALGDLGKAGLPYLIRGTRQENRDIQDWCYRELFDKFPDDGQTADAVLRGLESEHSRIRYSSAFFAGTQKIAAAKPKLREIYEDPQSDLQLTAAKSLAEMGESDVLPMLYRKVGSDWYMQRYQANLGLKALSGRDLNEFADETDGYDWSEGAFVSGGREYRRVHIRPIEDAEQTAQRYTALAAWSRWLKEAKPDLYRVLDPESAESEAEDNQR